MAENNVATKTLESLCWSAYRSKLGWKGSWSPSTWERPLRPLVREALKHNSRLAVRTARNEGRRLANEDLWDAMYPN